MPRLISRLANNNPKRAETLATLMLTAKGVPFIYYGEEIGMENIEAISIDEMKDVQGITHYNLSKQNSDSEKEALKIGNEHNRDKSRSPMQWNNQQQAGFSDSGSWIKIHQNYTYLNVKSLEEQENSLLNNYKKLIKLRNSEAILQYGKYEQLSFLDDCISFTREYNGNIIKCFFNFGKNLMKIKLNSNEKILLGETTIKPNSYLIIKEINN